jgi:hypothetical protein
MISKINLLNKPSSRYKSNNPTHLNSRIIIKITKKKFQLNSFSQHNNIIIIKTPKKLKLAAW